jgi:hypothetical protein
LDEVPGNLLADAAGGPGDDGDFVGKTHGVVLVYQAGRSVRMI